MANADGRYWGEFGKKEWTKSLARSFAVVAFGMRRREAGEGGS